MLKGHFESAGATLEYGDARELFPVDSLDATVYQSRDAEITLDSVAGADVIIVAPTSLATSYFLTQHVLTVIAVDSLSPAVQSELDDALDAPIQTFELIQIGRWIQIVQTDHSLDSQAPRREDSHAARIKH